MALSLIIGLTGASGIVYGLRLIQRIDLLKKKYARIYVIYSENARKIARIEENVDLESFLFNVNGLGGVFRSDDILSPLASSSNTFSSDMVIVPASLNTVNKIAHGVQDNLVTRVACNILRTKNKLLIVLRETPLSAIDLYNLYILAVNGAIIMPASPGFYNKPKNIDEIIDFMIGKILDVLGIENNVYRRWSITE
ncbi:MAG: UbiX family flavin prenyltransferase [Desulfurococcaceae archaeon]